MARSIILSSLFALAVILGLTSFLQANDVLPRLLEIPFFIWLGLGVITSVHLWLRFLRWRILLGASHTDLATEDLFPIYVSGFALTLIPSKLGENVRAVFLRERGVPVTTTVMVFFVERLLDVLAVGILSAFLVIDLDNDNLILPLALLIGLLILALAAIALFPIKFLRHPKVVALEAALHNLRKLKTRSLSKVIGLSGLAWFLQSLSLSVVVLHLGEVVSIVSASAIYCISLLAGAISMLPGGLGTTELTAGLLLEQKGMEFSLALLAMTVCRITTLWLAIVFGLVAYAYCSLKKTRLSAGSEPS